MASEIGVLEEIREMSREMWTTISIGVALAGLVLHQAGGFRTELREVRSDIVDLGERVARIETRLEYILPQPPLPEPALETPAEKG